MPDDSSYILKRNDIDRYKDQPNLSFRGGQYSVLNLFCFEEFVTHYAIHKSGEINSVNGDYQPHLLPDTLLESNHDSQYPNIIKLMNCNEKMKCRKVQRVFRYHVPNKHRYPEKYAQHLQLLFYPLRSGIELFGVNKTYQLQLRDENILSLIKNRLRFESYADLVDAAYTNRNAELISNQDAYGEIENFETKGALYSEHVTCLENNENRSIPNFSIRSFIPQILAGDEIAANIKSLNKKKRDVLI